MPDPTKARGAKSRANLRRGNPGNKSKHKTSDEKEAKKIARRLVLDPTYQRTLKAKLSDCTLHPSVQVLLWQFAFGKPKEIIETVAPVPVTIRHEYAE